MLYNIVVGVSIIWTLACLVSSIWAVWAILLDKKFRKALTFQK